MFGFKKRSFFMEENKNNVIPESEGIVYKDPLEEMAARSEEKLNQIKFVNASDIMDAFKDRDKKGKLTTCVEIREEYWEPISKNVIRSVSRFTSFSPELGIETSGGYTTLSLTFNNNLEPDIHKAWSVLKRFGEESKNIDQMSTEIPVLIITGIPLILGGQYGMVATDPIFWCLQPSKPTDEKYNEIRILFQPDAVLFLHDGTISTEEVVNKARAEFASEKIIMQERIKKNLEKEEFEKEKEKEISQYLEKKKIKNRSFRPSEHVSNKSFDKNEDDNNM